MSKILKGSVFMFNVGDYIVYPMHGAGTIDAIEEKDILGERQAYYVLKMPGEVKVMIPTAQADKVGIRNIIGKTEADKVFDTLSENEMHTELNWNKRYRENMDKMKTGDIYEIANVVRDLSFKQKDKGLSTGEKKMLTNAKQILVSELALVEDASQDTVESLIDEKLSNSFKSFRMENTDENIAVNKFIPFDNGTSDEIVG